MATALTERRREQDAVFKDPKSFRKDEESVKNTGLTPFDIGQTRKATNLVSKFMEVAYENPDNAIDKVIEAAINESKGTDPGLVRWALMYLMYSITNHPTVRNDNLSIPSLANRAPEVSVSKKQFSATGPIVSDKPAAPPAQRERWFREDPNFNEHQHTVYPSGGVPDPNNPDNPILKEHGEMLTNMRRQMLTRLDISQALPSTKPLDNHRDPIPERYKADEHLVDTDDYGSRAPNIKLDDKDELTVRKALEKTIKNGKDPILEGYKADEHLVDTDDYTPFGSRAPNIKLDDKDELTGALEKTIKNGKFLDGTEITPDLLSSTIESSDIKDFSKYYDSLHNNGHNNGHMMLAHDPRCAQEASNYDPGVMHSPVAARDPRHMDDLFNKCQETHSPHDFSDAPPVNIRGDIILAFKDKLPITNGITQDKEATEATEFGEKTFGDNNFDTDSSGNEIVTHEEYPPKDSVDIEENDCYYYFRVENSSPSQLDVAFRVYLAPEELANSRRHWIEMDKFKQTLPPKSKTVVCRDCVMSSKKTVDELDDKLTQPGTEKSLALPFHLLVPRGRKEGTKFKLLVLITDWSKDEVPTPCDSKYPDSRPMGYPFDKPFKNNSYKETFKELKNATIKDVSIKWVDDFPEIAVKA